MNDPNRSGEQEQLLDGDEQRDYLERVAQAIERARLGEPYPPPHRLAAQLRAMGPQAHGGLYGALRVDRRSGLPTYPEWARISTDAELCPTVLRDLPPADELQARAAEAPASIHGKQWLKHRYYSHLQTIDGASPSQMHVDVRRVDPEQRRAWFRVVLDKLDVRGVFVRMTVEMSQHTERWTRAMVDLQGDMAEETEALRALIYRMTTVDAELTFVQLGQTAGVEVERVVKGSVGPMYVAAAAVPAPLLEAVGSLGQDDLIASFAQDTAALDLHSDGDNDPLSRLAPPRTPEEQAVFGQARAELGYRVFKDRKFVVSSRSLEPRVHAFCRRAGTRNVVYTMRGRR